MRSIGCCVIGKKYLLYIFLDKTRADITDDIVAVFAGMFFLYIFMVFALKQNKIIRYLRDFKDYEEFGKPHGLQRLVRRQRKYTYLLYFYCHIGACVYGYVSYMLSTVCEKNNQFIANTCGK